MSGLATVTVDVDTLAGMPRHGGSLTDQGLSLRRFSYDILLPRLLELFDECEVRATFFIVGRDAQDPVCRSRIRELRARGHEIANHTFGHPANFCGLPRERQVEEILTAQSLLEDVTGAPVVGFRAPAYSMHPGLFALLAAQGYRYDSSVNTSLPLHLVKQAVLLVHRQSRQHLRLPSLQFLRAPRRPYFPSFEAPWREDGQRQLLEIPISCVPYLGFPLVGWWLLGWPRRIVASWWTWVLRQAPAHVNFALHDYDVIQDDDPYAHIARRLYTAGFMMRQSAGERLAVLRECLSRLQAAYRLAPFAELAGHVGVEAALTGR